ncbi:myo-inosose-2 dehydratase [Enterobacteriaceae bacterium RIT697]|nr:myo-inosose-2 dehydratase [Enterobacteriaceae bacterium RIT697]
MVSKAINLGVSPLCWTNDVLDDLGGNIPLEVCLQQAAQAGFSGIELGRKFPRDPLILRPLLDSVGLQLASGWYSGFLADRSIEDELIAISDHAHLLKQLGASVLVYGECGRLLAEGPLDAPLSQTPTLNSLDLIEYANKINILADVLLRDYNLKLAYHHHLMMVIEHNDELQSFLAKTNDNVGLVFDTGHAFAAGVNIPALLQNWGHRIVHLHLKDVRSDVLTEVRKKDLSFNAAVRAGLFTIPGEGSIDFAPLIAFIAEGHYQGWLIVEAEQDPQLAPPLATATRAAKWMRQNFSVPTQSETLV